MNGFDRVANDEKKWFNGHRSLPLTPEQYTASLWSEVDALKEAISMPAEDTATRPRQKDSLDELLANFEFARIKEYVDKRSREEAQAQMTAKPVGTVQHCSPCSPNPHRPSGVYFILENNEGNMGQELEKLESSSADTGLETPGQQGSPNEGTWEQRRTTANAFLTAGVDSSTKGNIATSTVTVAASLRMLRPHQNADTRLLAKKTSSSTLVGEKRRARLGKRLYLYFVFLRRAGRLLVCASCFVRVYLFSKLLIYPGETYQQAERRETWTRIKSLMYATGGQAFSRPSPF